MAKYLVPCGSLKVFSVVWKVRSIWELDPVARTRNGESDGTTARPLLLRNLATAVRAAGVGAKRASYCPVWRLVPEWRRPRMRAFR